MSEAEPLAGVPEAGGDALADIRDSSTAGRAIAGSGSGSQPAADAEKKTNPARALTEVPTKKAKKSEPAEGETGAKEVDDNGDAKSTGADNSQASHATFCQADATADKP